MSVAGNIVVELELDNNKMIVGVKQAGAVLRQFQSTLGSTSTAMKRVEGHTESLGEKFRNIVITLGNLRFVAMDINDVFLRLPVAIMKTAGELERTQVLLSGLSKEMSKTARDAEGAANFDYITKMAQRAPFEIGQLSDAFVKFKSAGIDPTNGSMQALVDSVAKFGGNGEALKRASVAIQQMAGKGVVSMEELRQQLGEAVPSAMQDMATGMGMSMADLTAAVSKGTVEATDAINKMLVVMAMRNDGAAQEMMQTWTGIVAQLKTQTDLAFKDIAESGFGDATKRAATQISEALNSVQFKQFSDSAGSTLGNTVDSLTTLSRTLIENIELIKTLATVWIAYKIAASTVGPSMMGIADAVKKTTEEYRSQMAVRVRDLESSRTIAIEKATLARTSAQEEVTASAAKIATMRAELVERQKNTALIRQNYAETSKALLSLQPTGKVGDKHLPINREDVQAYASNLARLEAENARAMRGIKAEIAATELAHTAASTSVKEHTAAINALEGNAVVASRAMTAMGTAAKLAGSAFQFLGGWATVLNLAITAGIYAWVNWGKAAEEAAERAHRARKGIADQSDLDGLFKSEQEIQKKREAAQKSMDFMTNGNWQNGTAAQRSEYNKVKAVLDDLSRQAMRAAELRGQAQVSVNRENARLETEQILRESELKASNTKATTTKEVAAIEDKYAKLVLAAGDNKAKVRALLRKQKDELFGAEKASAKAQISSLELEIKAQKERFGGPNGDAAIAAVQGLSERLKAAKDRLAMVVAGTGPNKFLTPDKKAQQEGQGGAKHSEIDELIKRLEADRAGLDAELGKWNGVDAKVDEVAGIIAKMQADFDSGRVTDADGKKPSVAKQQRAMQTAVDNANREKEIKDAKTHADQVKAVADYIEGMRPEVEAAMELLNDPMGASKVGAKEKQTIKWISKNQDKIKAMADDAGKSVKEIQDQMLADAQRIDDSQTFSKIVQETATMNAALVEDSRMAAKAKMDADNEEFRNYMQQLIEKRRASGRFSKEELDRMQARLDASMAARAATTAQKTMSPMEQLAVQWQNTTKNMQEATARWGQQAMDVFTNAALTGKLEFSDMARSILADMAKIAMQKAMGSAVSSATSFAASAFSAFAFADGGIMNGAGSMPLKKYASGGIARSPQMAIFGEGDMAEAYVPLPDGRSIPVTMSGALQTGGGGDNVMVQINVTEGGASNSTASGDSSGFYQQLGERVKAVVQQELATQMRPGGVLAR